MEQQGALAVMPGNVAFWTELPSGLMADAIAEAQRRDVPFDGLLAQGLQMILESKRVATLPDAHRFRAIKRFVCEMEGITEDELKGPARDRRYIDARQIVVFLAREHTELSSTALGKELGNRDHTTILHAQERAGQRLITDKPFAFKTLHALHALGLTENHAEAVAV